MDYEQEIKNLKKDIELLKQQIEELKTQLVLVAQGEKIF